MKRNKILVISTCLALLYIGFALYVLIALGTQNSEDMGGLFAAIFSIFLIPSSIIVGVGVIFGWFAYQRNDRSLTLISLILYLLGAMIGLLFGLLMIPCILLNLISFIQQVSSIRKDKDSELGLIP